MPQPAMAWPAAQIKAIAPPAIIHQFMTRAPCSHSPTLFCKVAQAQAGRHAPLGGILELGKSGIDPAAAMGLDRGSRQSVVTQPHHRSFAVGLEQEFYRRLPGLESFDAAPGEHHFAACYDLEVGPFDRNAGGARDAKHTAGPGVGLHQLGEPSPHVRGISQEGEHRFGGRIDPDLKPNVPAVVAHLVLLPCSTASATCFSRRSRGRQNPSIYATSSSKASLLTT